jgi:hypothetical protein
VKFETMKNLFVLRRASFVGRALVLTQSSLVHITMFSSCHNVELSLHSAAYIY